MTDDEIMRALIAQVSKAAQGKSELEVTTFITKPLWNAFLRAVGEKPNTKPTKWNGLETVRVFGSATIVVPGKKMWSASFRIERT